MEGLSVSLYKKYLRRKRGYQRINESGQRWRSRVVLGGGSSSTAVQPKSRRFWGFKIKVKPKLALLKKLSSPKKFFIWLRDAYVKMMLSFANSRVMSGPYGGGAMDNAISAFGKRPPKEYDERMITEIYKSLAVAQGQLVVHRNAANRFGNSKAELATISECYYC